MAGGTHEIGKAEMEVFARSVEFLEPPFFTDVDGTDVTTPHEFNDSLEENDIIIIERGIFFEIDGILIEVQTSTIIDNTEDEFIKAFQATTTETLATGGLKLVIESDYILDWHSDERGWEALFRSRAELHNSDHEQPTTLPGDYEREVKAFKGSSPTEEEVKERDARIAREKEESGSVQVLENRFTMSRFRKIFPLLQKLGPEHVVNPPED